MKLFLKFIVITLWISLWVFVCVWIRFEAVHIGYKIQALHKQIDTLNLAINKLEIEANTLASPERIERIARENFGMVIPNDKDVVIVKV